MMNFTSDQWVIIALIFILGLLVGGFLFSGGGRKWKTRFREETTRREDLERRHGEAEKEWRERDSLRGAALKDRTVEDRRVEERRVEDRDPVAGRDRDADGLRDDRDPVDNRKL